MTKKNFSRAAKWFPGIKIKDAKANLIIKPSAQDIKGAVRNDPEACVFAKACKRMYGSSKVIFFKTYSYIEMPDKNGNPVVLRFVNPKIVQDYLAKFDKGKKLSIAGFTLKAPTPGHTISHLKKSQRLRRAERISKGNKPSLRRGKPIVGRYANFLHG